MKIRPIRIVSALVAIATLMFMDLTTTKGWKQFLYNSSPGLLVACALPWLILLRRKLFKTPMAGNHGWVRATTILLLIAILLGPLVTAIIYLWMQVTEPIKGLEGLGPVLLALIFHLVSFGAWVIAFFIQLWRDQWNKVLNTLAITYHLGAFLFMIALSTF